MNARDRLAGEDRVDALARAVDGASDRPAGAVAADAARAAPLLDVHVAEKRHGAQRILHDVRLQLAAGEVVALVGASGCGKSTLLRIVAGLDADFTGEVRLDGAAQAAPSAAVGFVFQEPRLFPWCSVADNVAFAAGGVRRGGAAVRARVAALLAEVGLAGLGEALPRALSGGQAQRVALARALFGAPRLLLLDEPFSAVDAFTRTKLQDVLLALVARHHVAALLVTHDLDEAVALGDRVLVLDAAPGRIREQVAIPAARPRRADDAEVGRLRGHVLRALHATQAFR